MMLNLIPFEVSTAEAGHTLAKVLRSKLYSAEPSWNQIRNLIEGRNVKVGDAVCSDPARRLKEGEVVTLLSSPQKLPKSATTDGLVIRHLDDHIVVVEKPAGVNSVRHPSELEWPDRHRALDPTLQDLTLWSVSRRLGRPHKSLPPLRIVHRLDRDTSGLLVFARSHIAERELGLQFRRHTILRRYLALVAGHPKAQTIQSSLVRDRGDGRRGSTILPRVGKLAVTHIEIEERFTNYSLLSCRLETGRTHQIRIHLSESGHPVCGDRVYCQLPNGTKLEDRSGAKRLALHALELGFIHPTNGQQMHWTMTPPQDLARLFDSLRVQ